MPRVLVVDDNTLVRMMLKSILLDEGYDVDVADDGLDAISAVREIRPDIIITDFYMTKMHGDELVKAVRDGPGDISTIPIIGLAGTAESEKRLRGAGVDEYIAKPFMRRQLLEAIRTLLQKK
jgi:CheY-like chemotaxis protein